MAEQTFSYSSSLGLANLYNLQPASKIKQRVPVQMNEDGNLTLVDPATIPTMPDSFLKNKDQL